MISYCHIWSYCSPLRIIISILAVTLQPFAGSCLDHIKVNSIANIQTDGGDVLVRSDSFKPGQGFQWSIPANATFRLTATQNADFKRNSLAELLAAKATKDVVYLQLSFVSTNTFQIEKVAVGASTLGLECTNYP